MLGDDEIQEMREEVMRMEQELAKRKRALHEAKYASLREAVRARDEAEKVLQEELQALGVRSWSSVFR